MYLFHVDLLQSQRSCLITCFYCKCLTVAHTHVHTHTQTFKTLGSVVSVMTSASSCAGLTVLGLG